GVKLAKSPADAEQLTRAILGMQLVTHQTGPHGQKLSRVLIEEAAQIAQELYVAVTLDRAAGKPIVMASTQGGMDIEEVAAKDPAAILRIAIDPHLGVLPFQARTAAFGLQLSGNTAG